MAKELKIVDALQAELKIFQDRVTVLERQNLDDRIEKLQSSHFDLEKRHSELKGVATVLGLIFAVLGSLGGYSAFKYWEFNNVQKDSYELFIDHFQDKLADAIDRVRLIQQSGEFDPDLSDLIQMKVRIKNLGINSSRFNDRADLAESLRLFVNSDYEGAKREATKLSGHENHDDFVVIRALTLQALADIKLHDRHCTTYARDRLREAIDINKGVPAAAFNGMALWFTEEVRQLSMQPIGSCQPANTSPPEATEAFKMAMNYYRLAYDLKPTVHNFYRYLNNKVWLSSVLYNAVLKGCYAEKDFLILVESDSIAGFLSTSQQQLDIGKGLEQNKLLITETEAELLCLKAKFARQHHSNEEAKLHEEAKRTYQLAIKNGLFNDMNCEEAWKSFNDDELLEELWSKGKDKEEIKQQINRLCNPN